MTRKKTLIIVGIAVLIIVMIFITWLNFRNAPTARPTQSPIPTLAGGRLEQLFSYSIVSFQTNDGKNFNYLDSDHLSFYKINIDEKNPQKLIEVPVYYVDTVIWSPTGKNALLKVQNSDESNSYWFVNLADKKYFQLDESVLGGIWTPDNKLIVNTKENTNFFIKQLNQADMSLKAIADIGTNRCDTLISINGNLTNAICVANQSDIIAYLITIDLQNKTTKRIEGEYTTAKSNFNNSQIIALKNENNQSYWTLINPDGIEKIKKISFDTDQFDIRKIAFSPDEKFLIFAVRQPKIDTDTFYKVETQTGSTREISYKSDKSKIDAQNLFLSSDAQTLYFTSNDILYQLTLP